MSAATWEGLDLDALKGHTPGPWIVAREFNVTDLDGRGTAAAGGYSNNQVDVDALHFENAANARLCAAAPALLALAIEQREVLRRAKMIFEKDINWNAITNYPEEPVRTIGQEIAALLGEQEDKR